MSGNIKGITIELGGDTKGLDAALKSVTSQSATLGKDLKTVNQLLKLDPGNAELVAQKQQILAQSIEATAEKLEILRAAQEQVKAQFDAGEISREQYIAFQDELVRTEKRMEQLTDAQSDLQSGMDGTADSTKSLSETVSDQKRELSDLKSKYVETAAAKGEDSEESRALADQIRALSDDLKENEDRLNELREQADQLGETEDELGDDTDELGDEEEETTEKTHKLGEALKNGLAVAAKAAAAAVVAATAAVAGCVTGMVKATAETAEYGDNIDKMSQKLGMSAEAYQEWDFIMQHSGSSIDGMTTSMKKLSDAVVNQSDKSVAAFSKLGISMEDAANMSQEELFSATITALQGMESGAERTALATDLLGKSAMELGPLLNTSAEETEAMRQQVHELGGVMSDDAVKASARYQDSLQNMQTAVSGVTRSITSQLMPSMSDMMDGIAALVSGDSNGIELITNGLRGFTEQIGDILPQVTAAAEQLLPVIVDAVTANLPMILGAAASIVTTLMQGLLDNLPQILAVVGDVIMQLADAILGMLPQMTSVGLQIIMQLAAGIAKALPKLAAAVVKIIPEIVKTLAGTFPTLIQTIVGIVPEIAKTLTESLPTMIPMLVDSALDIVDTLVDALIDNADLLLDAAIQIVMSLGKGLINALPRLLEKAPVIIKKLVDAIIKNLPLLIDASIELIVMLAQGIIENLPALVDAAVQIVGALAKGILQAAGMVLKAVGGILSGVGDLIDGCIQSAVDWGKGIILSVVKGIGAMFGAVKSKLESLGEAIFDRFQKIKATVSAIIGAVKAVIGAAWDAIHAKISAVLGAIKATVTAVLTAVSSVVSNIWDKIKTTVSNAMTSIKDTVSRIWDNVKTSVSGAITGIKTTIVNGFEAAVAYIKSLPSQALQWGKDIIGNIVKGIKDKISTVTDAVSGVAGKIKSFLHFSVPDEGPLTDFPNWMPDMMQGLAKGIKQNMRYVQNAVGDLASTMVPGIDLSPALAQYSSGRLMMPQAAAATAASGGGGVNTSNRTYNINVNVQQMSSDYDARRAAEIMAEEIDRLTQDNNSLKGAWSV